MNAVGNSPYWIHVSKTVTLYGGSLEQITVDNNTLVTTNSDGSVITSVPYGTHTYKGVVSGQSFARTVGKDTTELKVMPEGIIIYWYGNMPKSNITNTNYRPAVCIDRTPYALQLSKNTNNLQFVMPVSMSSYHGTSFFEAVDVTGYTKMCSIASANPYSYSGIHLATNMIDNYEVVCSHTVWNKDDVIEYKETSIQYDGVLYPIVDIEGNNTKLSNIKINAFWIE